MTTKDEIFDILRILKVLKQMIIDRVLADEVAKTPEFGIEVARG